MDTEYCRCRDCENLDEDETSGYKCYCTSYGTYEDPDAVRECRRFEER